MNWGLVYAISWWTLLVGVFIVAPVVGSRYRGAHRERSGRTGR